MKRMLMLTHMGQMIAQFNKNNIEILLDMGVEVHLAGNFSSPENTMTSEQLSNFCYEMRGKGVFVHQIDFERGIGTVKSNLLVWRELIDLCSKSNFDFIHCQSPLGGAMGRLIGNKFNIPVIYTTHGFHFFKGSPKRNWAVFYPVEKLLSRYTDIIVTINSEDFEVAKKFVGVNNAFKIPGVGIDYYGIQDRANKAVRNEVLGALDIPTTAKVLISVGELSDRKNQIVVLKALAQMKDPNVYYIMCGIGVNKQRYIDFAKKQGLENNVRLLGYRNDVPELYGSADICLFPSRREGLGLAGLEAMASGLPVISSNVNGIMEYMQNGKTGIACSPNNVEAFAAAIKKYIYSPGLAQVVGGENKRVAKKFDRSISDKIMSNVYIKVLKTTN